MGIGKKLWKANNAYYTSKAKGWSIFYPIIGYILIGIGLFGLIISSISGDFTSGLIGFIIMAILGGIFLLFANLNKRALIKTKSINKSQTELLKDFFKSVGDLFKKN